MIDVKAIRTDVTRALTTHTQKTVIVAEQDAPKPPYPYTSIKFTDVGQRVGGTSRTMRGNKRVHKQNIEMTLSVTNIAASVDDATNLAYAALAFFETKFHVLSDVGIVVVRTTALTDRTTALEVGFEYKVGFDVRLRVHSTTVHDTDRIDRVTF